VQAGWGWWAINTLKVGMNMAANVKSKLASSANN
jgi:hypothetical protein